MSSPPRQNSATLLQDIKNNYPNTYREFRKHLDARLHRDAIYTILVVDFFKEYIKPYSKKLKQAVRFVMSEAEEQKTTTTKILTRIKKGKYDGNAIIEDLFSEIVPHIDYNPEQYSELRPIFEEKAKLILVVILQDFVKLIGNEIRDKVSTHLPPDLANIVSNYSHPTKL